MCESGYNNNCQHLVGFSRETDLGYVLDECPQDLVLFEFGLEVMLHKGGRTERALVKTLFEASNCLNLGFHRFELLDEMLKCKSYFRYGTDTVFVP